MTRHTEYDVAAAIADVVRRLPKTAWCTEHTDAADLCIGLDNGQHFDVAVIERIGTAHIDETMPAAVG